VVLAVLVGTTVGWAGRDPGGRDSISQTDLREWLSYIASDALEGRAAFSEGFALGTDYVARHLQEWGVKPAGDHGTYFQRVAVLGVQADNRSTLTVAIGGQTRTFKQGEGIRLPANVGSKRTVVLDRVEFVGYGLDAPFLNHADYAGKDVTGKAIVWLGSAGPKIGEPGQLRRLLAGRNRYALEDRHAAAVIGPQVFGQRGLEGAPLAGGTPAGARPAEPPGVGAPGRQSEPQPDFTTVQRLDSPIPPSITAQDALFEFLFSQADVKYPELKAMAEKQEPLPSFELKGVKITVDLDATYKVVRTQYTHNVVGIVEGADPSLRSSYVAFGAHADHVGYATGEIADGPNGPRRLGAPGRVKDGAVDDRIWNGADDDGSGTVTLMALARAFALGVRPKRSLLFVWHAGEERGLWGSRYFADYPSVPLGSIVAQFNMDMVGRNRNDNDAEANSVYLVGSDRISTELHNIGIDANASLPKPLRLDFEMNDPSDPEGIYYRSDHYSYAAKGIPIVFYTTGLHPDYHTNKDEVDRINFEKMARIGQLVYETGRRVAELQHPPLRDNKGPRAGKGASGKLPTSGRHSFNGRPNRSAIR
jgi:hypothetical protein